MEKEKNNNMDDLFSVIILTYNNSQYLQGCIDSVLIQNYPSIEIIIADDCSNNFDCEFFSRYCKQHGDTNIKNINVYQNEENFGTVKNINIAIAKSKGRFIKTIAGDDQFADEFSLTNAAMAIKESSDGIITGDVIKCSPTLEVICMHPNHLLEKLNVISPQESFARLCVHNDINAGGIFFSRDFINHFGPFDENYRLLEDWPMWLKIFSQKARITYSPFNAIKYRSNVGFATSTNALYMEDKRRVLETIIIPQKKEIGLNYYWKARVSFWIRSSIFVRKIYGLLVRKGR